MTERERVLEAVAHRDTDIVPYQLDFTQRAASKPQSTWRSGFYGEDWQSLGHQRLGWF